MMMLGADTHKRSHTIAAVDELTGRALGDTTVRARRAFEELLVWARALDGSERVWAIEDCRHVAGALERFLLARGERVVRVPPKLMAGAPTTPPKPSAAEIVRAMRERITRSADFVQLHSRPGNARGQQALYARSAL